MGRLTDIDLNGGSWVTPNIPPSTIVIHEKSQKAMTNEKNGQKWRRSAIFRPDTTRSRWPIEISLRKTKTFSFFLRGDLSRYIPESSFTPFSFRLHRSQPKKTIILSSFQHDLSELCVRYSMCCYPAFTVPWNGGGKRSFLSLVPYRHRRDFLKRERNIYIYKERRRICQENSAKFGSFTLNGSGRLGQRVP